jgi:hypothetical protein
MADKKLGKSQLFQQSHDSGGLNHNHIKNSRKPISSVPPGTENSQYHLDTLGSNYFLDQS